MWRLVFTCLHLSAATLRKKKKKRGIKSLQCLLESRNNHVLYTCKHILDRWPKDKILQRFSTRTLNPWTVFEQHSPVNRENLLIYKVEIPTVGIKSKHWEHKHTGASISRQVTHWVEQMKALKETPIDGCTDVDTHRSAFHRSKARLVANVFTSASITIPLCLPVSGVPFLLWERTDLFHLFHCYLGWSTRDNNASSFSAVVEALPSPIQYSHKGRFIRNQYIHAHAVLQPLDNGTSKPKCIACAI